jgi:hypothetical protein
MRALSIGAFMLLVAATGARAQATIAADDSVSADIIMREIRAIGWLATDYEDASGDPRIETQIDRHNWAIVLHDCGTGGLDQRRCQSLQFIIDTAMPSPVASELINKWNKEYRYARASLFQGNSIGCPQPGNCTARIATDVMMTGTHGDPAKTFRAYFDILRRRSAGFRHYIGAAE